MRFGDLLDERTQARVQSFAGRPLRLEFSRSRTMVGIYVLNRQFFGDCTSSRRWRA
jgi:hypothetical protein